MDYGLAYRYCPEGTHKDYKEDPKRCHDGTLEYTSIDAHKGVGKWLFFSCAVFLNTVDLCSSGSSCCPVKTSLNFLLLF